jgi:RimJ/RimL family protein N-acetyltransferase
MMTKLHCATCQLRPPVPSDAGSLALHANDRDIWLNLRDRFPHPYSEQDAEEYIATIVDQSPVTSFVIIIDGKAVGGIGLTPGHDIERYTAEIGYWLGRAYWGTGVMTDAVRAITDYAFAELKLLRVFAVPFVRNPPSARVLQKAGYSKEGLMRASAVKDGTLLDQWMYAAYAEQNPSMRGGSANIASPPSDNDIETC